MLPLGAGNLGGKLTAMKTSLQPRVLFLSAGISVLLERNHRRTAGLPVRHRGDVEVDTTCGACATTSVRPVTHDRAGSTRLAESSKVRLT